MIRKTASSTGFDPAKTKVRRGWSTPVGAIFQNANEVRGIKFQTRCPEAAGLNNCLLIYVLYVCLNDTHASEMWIRMAMLVADENITQSIYIKQGAGATQHEGTYQV